MQQQQQRQRRTGARVLIADGDPAVADAVALDLDRDGHRVTCAATTGEALARAQSERFDLAILDIALRAPVRAIEVAYRLYRRDVPVILTGGPAHASGLAELFWPSLVKPFDGETLRATVHRVLTAHYGTL